MRAFNKGNGFAVPAAASRAAADVEPTKLKRLAEIRLGALSMRATEGDPGAQREHRKLVYAMSVHSQTGLPLAAAFTQLGVDTSKMLAAFILHPWGALQGARDLKRKWRPY
jgi:hypothetical protein